MYANLRVDIYEKGADHPAETVCAWKVTAGTDPETEEQYIMLFLDADDLDSSHVEPAGARAIDLTTHSISIGANW